MGWRRCCEGDQKQVAKVKAKAARVKATKAKTMVNVSMVMQRRQRRPCQDECEQGEDG